jgi:hypothetical protein
MKRFLTGCSILLILYVVAYDLKVGTLPRSEHASVHTAATKEESIMYQSYQVAPGDTVISIVERLNDNSSFSIATMVKDFKALNPGVVPENIQIQQTYRFPLYKKT